GGGGGGSSISGNSGSAAGLDESTRSPCTTGSTRFLELLSLAAREAQARAVAIAPATKKAAASAAAAAATAALATAAAAAAAASWPRRLTAEGSLLRRPWRLPPPPRPVFPVVVRFAQDELGEMLEVRSALWRKPEMRPIVADVWVGSLYAEAALSMLAPAAAYNSARCRWLAHVALDYFLPAYTVLQGLGALVPVVWRQGAALLVRLHADAGVRVLIAALHVNSQIARAVLSQLAWLMLCILRTAAGLLDDQAVRSLVRWGRAAAAAVAAPVGAAWAAAW
ncbi:unnamed protein product, partial [Phaeothamnion confervicola]